MLAATVVNCLPQALLVVRDMMHGIYSLQSFKPRTVGVRSQLRQALPAADLRSGQRRPSFAVTFAQTRLCALTRSQPPDCRCS